MAGIKKRGTRDRLVLIQEELDRLFSEFMEPQARDRYAAHDRRPEVRVDVYETESMLCVRAELPGMAREDVQLYISRDLLTIEGAKKPPFKSQKLRFLNMEREFGSIKREIVLPKPVDANTVKATLQQGVLVVCLPKISERRGSRRRLEID
ncbi:MAG: Hsp20/alpha crystallin family protein [Myxococcales bacterium]|nr:MAG: Hsp20/alpha crystallin family protein [Myxococcales bacterium]